MMNTFFLTDRGKVYNQSGQVLVIVADGMGGHRAGDVASRMAIESFEQHWTETNSVSTPDEAEKWLQTHVKSVNELIFHHSRQNTECEGMGTTLVVSICLHDSVTIAHIGDSRCYTIEENEISLVTEDHTLVNELVLAGQISKEDAEYHPRKNVILRALGTDLNVQVDIKTLANEELQYLLLCSDGLSNKMNDEEIKNQLLSNKTLEDKGAELVAIANDNGGEDNITLVLVEFNNVQQESGER
jgi:protein phosphatase